MSETATWNSLASDKVPSLFLLHSFKKARKISSALCGNEQFTLIAVPFRKQKKRKKKGKKSFSVHIFGVLLLLLIPECINRKVFSFALLFSFAAQLLLLLFNFALIIADVVVGHQYIQGRLISMSDSQS